MEACSWTVLPAPQLPSWEQDGAGARWTCEGYGGTQSTPCWAGAHQSPKALRLSLALGQCCHCSGCNVLLASIVLSSTGPDPDAWAALHSVACAAGQVTVLALVTAGCSQACSHVLCRVSQVSALRCPDWDSIPAMSPGVTQDPAHAAGVAEHFLGQTVHSTVPGMSEHPPSATCPVFSLDVQP